MLTPDEQLLLDVVATYSPSGREAAVARLLVERMAARGLRSWIDEAGNAVGELGEGRPHVVMLGHIDTVPGEIPVHVDEGRLYGRGAVDAKGPFVAFACAATRLAAAAGRRGRLTLVGAVEEEAVTSKGARHVVNRYEPGFVIIGEPSSWDAITLGYKGRLVIDYALQRPMSHTATRAFVPAEEAVVFWQKVLDYCRVWNDEHGVAFGQWGAIDPSLRRIVSGDDPFVQSVQATLGLRLPLNVTPAQAQTACASLAGDAQVCFSGAELAHRTDKSNALVRAFLVGVRQMGGEPRFKVKTGTSDMNVVAQRWRCPIVAYGPGDASLDHTPHEHIDLAEFGRAVDVLEAMLGMLLA